MHSSLERILSRKSYREKLTIEKIVITRIGRYCYIALADNAVQERLKPLRTRLELEAKSL